MHLRDMTWPEAAAARGKRVIIPIGSMEQHGPHLPVDTDTLLVWRIAEEVGGRLDCIVAPVISLGVSEEHMGFPGTLTLSPASFKNMVADVCRSLHAHGFLHQHILNYHGGNKAHLKELVPLLRKEKIEVMLHGVLGRLGKFDHAGDGETSLMLHLFPEKVRRGKIIKFSYRIPSGSSWKTHDHSESGVIGEASEASAEKGERYFKLIVDSIAEEVLHGKG